VVSIATYGFYLWYFAGAPTKAQVSLLATMQHKAALWILGAFHTSPSSRIEALAGLILIYLHLKKLVKWSYLRAATLPSQHALMSLLSAHNSKRACPHSQSLALLTDVQSAWLKSPLFNTKVALLNLTECFSPLDSEMCPGYKLLDNFPNCVSFHPCNHFNESFRTSHLRALDRLHHEASSDPFMLVVVTDASVIPPRNSATHF